LVPSSWVLIGQGTLLAGCGDTLLRQGQQIAAVISDEASIEQWAAEKGIRVFAATGDVASILQTLDFDHLASIAHLSIVPADALRHVRGRAINFHDGPLPYLAGLNVTSWAIFRGETTHGITWHEMTERADAGRILEQRVFEVGADETAFLLNAKCYAAALESFADVARRIANGDTSGREQDFTTRNYFGRYARPAAAAAIDFSAPAEEISRLVRGLDFGVHPNPLLLAKLFLGERFVAVGTCAVTDRSGKPAGTIVRLSSDSLQVATASEDVILGGPTALDGGVVRFDEALAAAGLSVGRALPAITPELASRLTAAQTTAARSEASWQRRLASLDFPDLDLPAESAAALAGVAVDSALIDAVDAAARVDTLIAAIAVLAARRSGASTFDIAYADSELIAQVDGTHGAFAGSVPLRVDLERRSPFADAVTRLADARLAVRRDGGYATDLWSRRADLRAVAQRSGLRAATVSVGIGVEPPPARLRFAIAADGSECRLVSAGVDALVPQLEAIVRRAIDKPAQPVADIDLMTDAEIAAALRSWNDTERPVRNACVHELFVEQAARTPDATALVFRGRSMSYRELDRRTNKLAHHLRSLGVGPGVLVGIFVQRSFAMVEAVLATLKAGGAYLPLDPTYPADRIAFMAEDAHLRFVLSEERLRTRVPAGPAVVISLDMAEDLIARESAEPVENTAGPSDLAYVIYTSGSTGRPKGVMIEHRNVANFGVGMDEHIDTTADQNTWLAVTSLSFDISVLELLWTLSRGFRVVLYRDDERESFVAVQPPSRPVDFSLFYFSSNEAESQSDKYRLLLEGARFADRNGFVAVWTPERHFHAFGGLFPNAAVTSAAVAAITERIGIRAGSVVSPLHSVLRIAEEWSVVDNLSNGRAAISFAPGWQPNDFVLRPESFGKRKDLMFEQIEQVRRLWRGESLPFVNGTGETIDVRVLPRPVQKELPVWVTIAGNPESFVAAGRVGANVLTHLLGQTVKEVGEKVELYRKAWREAGHAGEGIVTMMVHTFVGDSDEAVKDVVREPMKEYLRSAVGLVREAAWAFPTVKQKATNASGEFDPDKLSPEDFDALLEHAFDRYYSTSGLFGSPATARRFVEGLTEIGVNEVACLVDFGVPADLTLAHLPRLAELAAQFKLAPRAAAAIEPSEPETIPSLIEAYGVTHFQCTPTMAQIVMQDPAARPALGRLRQMLVGGEALPDHLARELASTVGILTNVYGPTETTVWSSTARVGTDGEVTIGFPIANTSLHIVDKDGRLAPTGLAGELCIGGTGVVRGYWNRPELTADRFIADPFCGGRMYRTGDLVRRRADGALDFLGRLDHQVKIRGHRIELGEIETRLREHSTVREAVVVARNDGAGLELVGYVIAAASVFNEADLRTHLRSRVPEYMMPRAFVRLDRFPMTPNRKIDRKALPAPSRETTVVVAAEARPDSTLEQTIAAIWCEVLELSAVGIDTNFADVGGHSLAMVRVLGRLLERVSPDVKLVDLFRFTTIRSLAKFLSSSGQPDETVTAGAARAASRRAALAQRRRPQPARPAVTEAAASGARG
jgi:natural product biosynthesis luciferase-like monooxygenase protein